MILGFAVNHASAVTIIPGTMSGVQDMPKGAIDARMAGVVSPSRNSEYG